MAENRKIRKSHLDLLRIIALFAVLFNHTAGYVLYKTSEGTALTWMYMTIAMLTRINWPMFLMISGALMLGKTDVGAVQSGKKAKRYIVLLIVYQIILLLIAYWKGKGPTTIIGWIPAILSNDFKGAYSGSWYLYAYIGYLIMLPYLRRIARDFDSYDFRKIIFLYCMLETVLPVCHGIMQWSGMRGKLVLSDYFELPVVTSRIFFWPLIGYYLEEKLDITTIGRKEISKLTGLMCLGVLLSNTFCYIDGVKNGFSQKYNSITCYVTAIWLFVCIKYWFHAKGPRISDNARKVLEFIASLAFGIYLMDPILKSFGLKNMLESAMGSVHVLGKSLSWCIISILVGEMCTLILKRIPKVKDYI